VARDGIRRLISWSNTALVDDQGAVEYVIGTGIDITERERAAQELRESDERYRTLYESSRDGIATANLEGFITECNQAYADMLGYSRRERRRRLLIPARSASRECASGPWPLGERSR